MHPEYASWPRKNHGSLQLLFRSRFKWAPRTERYNWPLDAFSPRHAWRRRMSCAVSHFASFAQMLMHERFSRPPIQDAPRAAATPDELIARAIALDEAANNSGAFAGALLVSFRPSHMPDSLALMHEHVLSRVKECA